MIQESVFVCRKIGSIKFVFFVVVFFFFCTYTIKVLFVGDRIHDAAHITPNPEHLRPVCFKTL